MDEQDGTFSNDFNKLSLNFSKEIYDEDCSPKNDSSPVDSNGDLDTIDSMHKDLLSKLNFSRFKSVRPEPRTPNHLDAKFIPQIRSKREEQSYFMDHKIRGKCIIINNTFFDSPTLPERKGTQVDRDRLTSTFKQLDFDVQNWDEKSAFEIRIAIDKLSKEDFTDHDCFVMCVLTHGDVNCLYAKDDKYYVEHLFDSFKSDLCKTLAGKPKIFIIQACRGDRFDTGSIINFDVEDSKSSDIRIPQWADFLMAYSTIPGYYSWRNTTNGSWFIQAFVSVLLEHYKTTDLLSIFTMVNQRVAYDFESNTPNLADFHQRKQIPMIASMLTRKVFLGESKTKKLVITSNAKQIDSTVASNVSQNSPSSSSMNRQFLAHQQQQMIAKKLTKEEMIKQQMILNDKMMKASSRLTNASNQR